MFARELISDAIPPLKTSDSVQKVFERMAEFRVNHLPIVNNRQFLGLLSDDDIIEVADYTDAVGSLSLLLYNPSIQEDQHIYDVIRLFYEQRLSIVPVLDKNGDYIGMISINCMMDYMATLTSVKEPGSIIILEMSNRDNSLSHMAQIVESDNAQILSSYIRSFPDTTRIEVTLKVNKLDVSGMVASFNRYNYTVLATFNNIKSDDGETGRYDQLMNYLDV
ncbi:MAG TPA: CBS domain-containing protein [Sphingobacteriaceae bacterium]|nr:CBS domain-containing protein [Sphingobacteriaceae bacterium]